jgi:recombination protein RecA
MTKKDIIKEFGDILHDAQYIIDNPPPLISVSPKIDIALGGGVPEGCLFILTGPEKIGKTLTALQFCRNAQRMKLENDETREIYYGDVEGRVKKRDILGIHGLDIDADYFTVVGSTKGHILSGEEYLSIFDKIIHNEPHSVVVVDSFSALASEKELVEDISDSQVAVMQKFIAKFTRRFANVLPINRVTVVGITHQMANIQVGSRKSKTEKSGTALKYAQDVKLHATHMEPLKQGDTQIGQKVHWLVLNSAVGSPGQKVTSIIKYGRGIWDEYELAELAKDFSVLESKGNWTTLPNGEKVNGFANVAAYLEENPNAYDDLKAQVFEMLGIEQ